MIQDQDTAEDVPLIVHPVEQMPFWQRVREKLKQKTVIIWVLTSMVLWRLLLVECF